MIVAKKLVVLGSINVDHILNVEDFPRQGETVTGNNYQIAFGGKGANQAVAAGRCGANISFLACVGNDDIGERICQQLAKDRIDTRAIESVADESTGVALIYVNSKGENMIGINAGANAAVTPEYLQRHKEVVINADALLMQLESPLDTVVAAAKIARQHHTQVILNPAPAQKLPDELLQLIDIITPNETEAEYLTGVAINCDADAAKASAILHSKGIKTVLITLGSRGVWLSHENSESILAEYIVAGFKVDAIDTIAAGDTFNGAFITALLEDKDMQSAIIFAHAAAAISVTRRGAQPSVPWRKETDAFLFERTKY